MRVSTLTAALLLLAASAASPGSVGGGPALPFDALLLPGGSFHMGADDGRPDEAPRRSVTVGSFYLGRREVTQEEWAGVMGANPSRFSGCGECPVESVSWEEVQDFLRRLSASSGAPVRLPTEAEWEYAASAGSLHRLWPGTEEGKELAEYAWFSGSFSGRTHPAGLKDPNAMGLHDMAGNVAEWCADWYSPDYYATSPQLDPAGPPSGSRRVVRGGSWLGSPSDLRISRRSSRSPGSSSPALGFRIAADGPPPLPGPAD